ncbi:hypothetical protein [Variovorax sp. 770b2]|nr:hypothetical protein [Variovorax sp. 770b2]
MGYRNIGAFIALFKRAFGITPTQYMPQACACAVPSGVPRSSACL